MSEQTGFSIQCPCCFEWMEQEVEPEEFAFRELSDLKDFLRDVTESSNDSKILKCKHEGEPWACPAPFQAVIYEGTFLKREDINVPNSWMDPYTFRLRKKSHIGYKEGYHVVLFCTHKVKRVPDIQLGHLLDLDLLSKAIHGICANVKGPVTIYSAKVLEENRLSTPKEWKNSEAYRGKVCWVPVETYDEDNRNPLLPPGYNPYCAGKRQIFYEHIMNTSSIDWSAHNDPNSHPDFLIERWECDNCYQSDLEAIAWLREEWNENKCNETRKYTCKSGFCERAVPIIVHDHFVGVAFCGQTFNNEEIVEHLNPQKDLVFIDSYIAKEKEEKAREIDFSRRRDHKTHIEQAEERKEEGLRRLGKDKKSLQGVEQRNFYLLSAGLDKRAKTLRDDVEKIQNLANTRYLHLRTRTEAFFRKEILQRIRKEHQQNNRLCIQDILDRMRQFWIFKASILFPFHYDSKNKILILKRPFMSPENKLVKYEGNKPLLTVEDSNAIFKTWLEHQTPFHYLYKSEETRKPPPFVESITRKFRGVRLRAGNNEYEMKDHNKKFFVAVPVYTNIWLFLFIERDKNIVSPLRPTCGISSISHLCQESIRETCVEVTHEFIKVIIATRLSPKQREYDKAVHRTGTAM